MKIEKQMLIAFSAVALFGGLSIYTLPLRQQVPPAPESGLTTEPCTLDEAIAECESRVQQNRAYLDGLLEHAEMEAQSLEIVMEPHYIPETEVETETPSETETIPETTVEIYQPVDSLMAPDLQAWVYAYSTMQHVDPFVVMAICERESACTSNILGDGGRAYGMMQIQPVWIHDKLAAHGYTEADLLMAEPNITIGIEILHDFLGKGRGMEWALTAYRYGPQRANACSTSDYSAWILSRADELRRQNNENHD